MVKIIWTQRSLTDLKSIAEYISKDSAKYASLTLDRIIDVKNISKLILGLGGWFQKSAEMTKYERSFLVITG